jgi:hypothetical protein
LKENFMIRRLTPAILVCEFVLIVMAAALPVRADVLPQACPASFGQFDPSERGLELSRFDQAPEECLKTIFMHCSAASEKEVLGAGIAMLCSTAYEALLKRAFKGDFETLLAWWRSKRAQLPSALAISDEPVSTSQPRR